MPKQSKVATSNATDPRKFEEPLHRGLAVLFNAKQKSESPWMSAVVISETLRDEFGISLHWRTLEAALNANSQLAARRKRSGRREFQLMEAGEKLLKPQVTEESTPAHDKRRKIISDGNDYRATPPTKEAVARVSNSRLPTVFIGSSVEGLPIAHALQENLEHDAEVTVWTQGVFRLSRGTLEELLRALRSFEFAIFVFSPDDIALIRDHEMAVVRDNVLFEFGLFMGALGQDRVFFVSPRGQQNFHLLTDLLGITPATFNPSRQDGNLSAALGTASSQIRAAIKAARSS